LAIDIKLSRALATCQSRLRLLENSQNDLYELSDLQALYSLQTELRNFIEQKAQEGIIHPDPLSAILADLDKKEKDLIRKAEGLKLQIKTVKDLETEADKTLSQLNQVVLVDDNITNEQKWHKTQLLNLQEKITQGFTSVQQFKSDPCIVELEVKLEPDLLGVAALERPDSHLYLWATNQSKVDFDPSKDTPEPPIHIRLILFRTKRWKELIEFSRGSGQLFDGIMDKYRQASEKCENLLNLYNDQEKVLSKAKFAADSGNYRTAEELTRTLKKCFSDLDYESIIGRAKSHSTALDSLKNKQNLQISMEGIRFSLSALELQYSGCKTTLENLAEKLNNLDDLSKKFPNSELESDIKSIATEFRAKLSHWEKSLAEQVKSKKSQVVFNWVMVLAALGFVLCVAIMNS
jgi:hypothetical protein